MYSDYETREKSMLSIKIKPDMKDNEKIIDCVFVLFVQVVHV
ncbi:MAG: hypothetical protein ACI8RD_000226 [Bacillariaceae sp.]|jgi:hypothetical protein